MLIRDNVYGTLEEDSWRRDFTLNSLYYDPESSEIIDYTGGFEDVKKRVIRIIGKPNARYQEDPVRMLRAIRFSAKLGFSIEDKTVAPFKKLSSTISHVSSSRLFDEITKLYQCGNAVSVQQQMIEYDLFEHLFPQTQQLLSSQYPCHAFIGIALENTDNRIKEGKPVTPAFLYAVFLWFVLQDTAEKLKSEGMDPLPAIEKAMSIVIARQNRITAVPKRFTQVIREIWILQYRLQKRYGSRAFNTLKHPRFRAAYDFLALRALCGDESMELADWWTNFQDADTAKQNEMVTALTKSKSRKRRPRRTKPAE